MLWRGTPGSRHLRLFAFLSCVRPHVSEEKTCEIKFMRLKTALCVHRRHKHKEGGLHRCIDLKSKQ